MMERRNESYDAFEQMLDKVLRGDREKVKAAQKEKELRELGKKKPAKKRARKN
jgi:hypothetical protein